MSDEIRPPARSAPDAEETTPQAGQGHAVALDAGAAADTASDAQAEGVPEPSGPGGEDAPDSGGPRAHSGAPVDANLDQSADIDALAPPGPDGPGGDPAQADGGPLVEANPDEPGEKQTLEPSGPATPDIDGAPAESDAPVDANPNESGEIQALEPSGPGGHDRDGAPVESVAPVAANPDEPGEIQALEPSEASGGAHDIAGLPAAIDVAGAPNDINTTAPSPGVTANGAERAPVPPRAPDEDALRLAEALIFASAEPVSARALQRLLPDDIDAETVLALLRERYAGRGVELVDAAGGAMFRTAPDLAPRLRKVIEAPRRLPRVAMETLAIIAYHQPMTRPEIEHIRGAALSQQTLDALLELNLISPKGRRETPGRPTLWGTTPEFLAHFGLKDLRELPRREDLLLEPAPPRAETVTPDLQSPPEPAPKVPPATAEATAEPPTATDTAEADTADAPTATDATETDTAEANATEAGQGDAPA